MERGKEERLQDEGVGLYPEQRRTGSLGYFGNAGLDCESWQSRNCEPFDEDTARACSQLAHNPTDADIFGSEDITSAMPVSGSVLVPLASRAYQAPQVLQAQGAAAAQAERACQSARRRWVYLSQLCPR